MADEIPIFPKAGSILINSGNVVNWNRLKRKLNQSPSDELKDCIASALTNWLPSVDKTEAQYKTEVECRTGDQEDKLSKDERDSLKLTVKIFLNKTDPAALKGAISQVLQELNTTSVETVLLSLHEGSPNSVSMDGSISVENLMTLWEGLEDYVEQGIVTSVGVSDLTKDQLEQLYNWAKIKPSINQVNLASCCVMPPELTEYAKENDIQLLTHNDPREILAEKDFQSILASACTDRDGEGWDLDWVVRYSAIKKCRGIIAAKGFICKGSRDIKKRK